MNKQVAKLYFSIKDDNIFNDKLTSNNMTLPLISEFIQQVMTFIKGSKGHKSDLDNLKTSISNGSLVISVAGETKIIYDAAEDYKQFSITQDLNSIDIARAKTVAEWQKTASKNQLRQYQLFDNKNATLTISNKTSYVMVQDNWVDVELYVYGKVFDMGGKQKANVHIELEHGKTIIAEANEDLLRSDDKNRLYKKQLVHIRAKQNSKTKDLKDEQLIAFEKHSSQFDRDEHDRIAKKAAKAWKSVDDATQWVEEIRGSNA